MSAQQLRLDGLHHSLEPTAGTWRGRRWADLETETEKALLPRGNQQRTHFLLGSISGPVLGLGIDPRFANGMRKIGVKIMMGVAFYLSC